MLTLSSHFALLLSNIEPDSERLALVKEITPKVRDLLRQTEELVTVEPHTRLAGSYPRSTAINHVKDVDTLVFVHKDYLAEKPSSILSLLYKVLKDIPETLGYTGRVTLRRQRRSIHVHFDELDIHLDVVPAIIPDDLTKPLWVPDRGWEKWVKTHPLGYQTWLSDLNGSHSGKVVPLVKLTKNWKDLHFTYKRPKSYWLECMVVRQVDKGWLSPTGLSYGELFTNLLAAIYERYEHHLDEGSVPRVPDPMLGNDVAWNWERTHFETFMNRVKESHGWASRALKKTDAHVAEAMELWQKVFDGTFPTVAEVKADEAARFASAAAGGLYVDSSGRVTTTRPANVPGYQSPPHRFYGDERSDQA